MLTCMLNEKRINCFDKRFTREELKKWAKKKILICPACGKPYEYCHGKIKSPYFRHMDKVQCEDRYSEPETEEHVCGKRDLYEWLKKQPGVTDCCLEGWIPETKQRPDIMFKYNDQLCVIEYQCSPISSEYFERHNLYEAAGIKDIWICGTNKYFQFYHTGRGDKSVNILEDISKIYYDPRNGNIYTVDHDIKEKMFKRIIDCKTSAHIMRNPFDYRINEENYYLVKETSKSYSTDYYYPSGRPSNKYRYPVARYHFYKNVSLAKCLPLRLLILKAIN